MIERILITLALIGVGCGAYAISTRLQTAHAAQGNTGSELLDRLRPGIPAVIYFWSETCPPCRTVQKPALEQLQRDLGSDGVQVLAVNALEEPELANGWGVLGLPTTFIIDDSGEPRRVNHGVTRANKLKQQITEVSK